jgi:hypothetical protein
MSSEMPVVSNIATEETESVATAVDLSDLLSVLKEAELSDIFKVIKTAVTEAEKRSKGVAAKARSTKKAGSMPKGIVPPQLRKPRAWVDFTLQHALENGWEKFTIYQTKKDKVTQEKIEEEIEMPGSILHDGAYVYEGSVTEKNPNGKQLIHKDAMSLSKQRWAPKEQVGTNPELYKEFEAKYVDEVPEVEDNKSTTSSVKKVVVRKTAAEKEKEAAEKKAAKEKEKADKKAAKELEKAALKAQKEAEKALLKEQKEKEKADKKAAKESAKKPAAAKGPVPAAAVKKAATVVKAVPAKANTTKVVAKKAIVAPVAQVVEWTCPDDGMVHPWSYKGKTYLRNTQNEVWTKSVDGGCGEWQGIYLPTEDRIDDSVEEPVFDGE